MKKGQFFLIGSVILIGVLAALTLTKGSYNISEISEGPEIVKNVVNEFPIAINSVISNNTETEYFERVLRSYIRFQEFYMKKYGLNSRTYFLVGVPYSNNVNVTVGNFYGTLKNLRLSLGNETKEFSLNNSEIKTLNFKDVPVFYTVYFNLTADGENLSHHFRTFRKVFFLIKITAEFNGNQFEEINIG